MNVKMAEEAIAWTRALVGRNKGELSEWGMYQNHVKAHLNDPYNVPFKIPAEYEYAYLRVKGLGHLDALERMGLEDRSERSHAPSVKKESWWKFW